MQILLVQIAKCQLHWAQSGWDVEIFYDEKEKEESYHKGKKHRNLRGETKKEG